MAAAGSNSGRKRSPLQLIAPTHKLLSADAFSVEEQFAEGGAGTIHRGKLLDWRLRQQHGAAATTAVAVKVFKNQQGQNQQALLEAFLQEVAIMEGLAPHPNIATLIGYMEQPQLTMVMKMYSESLHQWVSDTNRDLPYKYVFRFAVQIASGLYEMHSVGLVHNDVKSHNVLLELHNNRYTAVITDFGLSRPVASSANKIKAASSSPGQPVAAPPQDAAQLGMSLRYAAPEIFGRMYMAAGEQVWSEQSKKADVYAYAIILYEMLERKAPWSNLPVEKIELEVRRGMRPEISRLIATDRNVAVKLLLDVMRNAWSQDVDVRPSFGKIIHQYKEFADVWRDRAIDENEGMEQNRNEPSKKGGCIVS